MLIPPDVILPILQPFSTLFHRRTWAKAQLLLFGAILSPRKRTITSALRVMGLGGDYGFAKYHHVLNRAVFSHLQLSRVLLFLLVQHLGGSDEPMVFGIDETIERRWGRRISALGVYRDAVRSSESHVVKHEETEGVIVRADFRWIVHRRATDHLPAGCRVAQGMSGEAGENSPVHPGRVIETPDRRLGVALA